MLEKELIYLRSLTDFTPEIAIVLGSGLGDLANITDAVCTVDYGSIPGMAASTAPGHKGRYIFGFLAGRKVAVMQGRLHLYEGLTPQEVVKPLRLLRMAGADKLLLTNAAGGIRDDLRPGDFMLLSDHISFLVPSALTGKNDDCTGVRFPDMSCVYSKRLALAAENAANEIGASLKKGVYLQLTGPNFETPAEIRAAKILGADAVGMSTAIEAQAAVHCGFEVCALSLISNLACGIGSSPLTEFEVKEAADKAAPVLSRLIEKTIGRF